MDDLIAFLNARLDEAEQVAQDCASRVSGKLSDGMPMISITGYTLREHYHLLGPAHVLADVAAKRRLLALHRPRLVDLEPRVCCAACEPSSRGDGYPCLTLRLLALPYSVSPYDGQLTHPDYREEWRP